MRFTCEQYPFLYVAYSDVEGGSRYVKFQDGALEVEPSSKAAIAALAALEYVTAVDAPAPKPATKKPAARTATPATRTRRPTTKKPAAK